MTKKPQHTLNGMSLEFGLYARTLIAVEMKRRGLTFRDLTEKLNATFHIGENERNIRNKVARATFSAAFMLMCFVAMDEFTIKIDESAKKAVPSPGYSPMPE